MRDRLEVAANDGFDELYSCCISVKKLIDDACFKVPVLHSKESLSDLPEVGAKVKVQWNVDEVKESGWRSGWYSATVQQYNTESDTILIVYSSEPDNVYKEELTRLISAKKIKLVSSPL